MIAMLRYGMLLVVGLVLCASAQAKLREPVPFEDDAKLYVFEAEPSPLPDNKTEPAKLKAHVVYPEKVITDGKYYSDSQSLIMVFKGYQNVPVTLAYPIGDVKPGEYRWMTSLAIGGKGNQKIEIHAGPDAEHLTIRGKINKNNEASWKNEWMKCHKPVHIDKEDQLIHFVFTGSATDRKIIDAMLLEPLGE
jgi:hypothetical protein